MDSELWYEYQGEPWKLMQQYLLHMNLNYLGICTVSLNYSDQFTAILQVISIIKRAVFE